LLEGLPKLKEDFKIEDDAINVEKKNIDKDEVRRRRLKMFEECEDQDGNPSIDMF